MVLTLSIEFWALNLAENLLVMECSMTALPPV